MWNNIKPIVIVLSVGISIVLLPYLVGKIILIYRWIKFFDLAQDNKKCQKRIDRHLTNITNSLSSCHRLKSQLFLSAYKQAVAHQNLKETERLSGVCCQNIKKGNNPEAIKNVIRSLVEIERLIEIIKANKQIMYRTARLANLPVVKFTRAIDKL